MKRSRAFTMIELVLASALCTVLMVGVLGVITSLSGPDQAMVDASHGGGPSREETIDALARLLRSDLAHATAVEVVGGSDLVIQGNCGLDESRRTPTHRPVEVRYKVMQINGRPWLVRRQQALDTLSSEQVQRDVVCAGVSRLALSTVVNEWGIGKSQVETAPSPETPAGQPAASPPQPGGTQAEGEVKPNSKLISVTVDGRTSYLVEGLMYYREYVPKWMLEEEGLTRWTRDGRTKSEPISQGGPASAGAASGGAGSNSQAPSWSGAGMVWRVSVWTDDSDQSRHDRFVNVMWEAKP